jgi:transcriptional regulator with XRE-family HTH domain
MAAGVGRSLIEAREAAGLTQAELAQALGIPEAQVARDERNEYRGLSSRHARRLLGVLQAHASASADALRPPSSFYRGVDHRVIRH